MAVSYQQISIYKIENDTHIGEVIKEITKQKYAPQSLSNSAIGGYSISLFYKRNQSSLPDWKNFLAPIVNSGQPVLENMHNRSESYILLATKNDGAVIYAATGGFGHSAIKNFIQNDFGIDILSRLETKEDRNLKATKELSLTSGVLGVAKHFRKNFTLYENQEFGTIYQELKAGIDKQVISENFGLDPEYLKDSTACIAKNSFKISEAINIPQLIRVMEGCENVLLKDRIVVINNVKKLTKRKNKDLIDALNNKLFDDLWKRYSDDTYKIDFDLCNREFEEYLTADHYVVMKPRTKKGEKIKDNPFGDYEFPHLTNADDLFSKIKEVKGIDKKERFIGFIKNLRIVSYDSDGDVLTDDPLLDHLMGDVSLDENGQKFFCLDKQWYQIEAKFVEDLNKTCNSIISDSPYLSDFRDWHKTVEKEGEYNDSYIGAADTIVLDRVLPENIELCDILRWDDKKVYLIHVKAGFTNTMRELCAQIAISAKRLVQDLNGDNPAQFLRGAYQAAISARESVAAQFSSISEQQFVDLFTKDIVYVLAVLDESSLERSLADVTPFNSTIAKFSLCTLAKDMSALRKTTLQIAEIKKLKLVSAKVAA